MGTDPTIGLRRKSKCSCCQRIYVCKECQKVVYLVWPEWDPCRERIRVNHDCGRGREFPSVGDTRKRLKLIHARLAMFGPCPCDPGLSSGLPNCLVGLEAHCNNTAQAWLPDALCTKYHIPACVHPSLPSPDKSILQSPDGKIGVYTRFFDFANYRLPLSQFLVDVLDHFRIHLSQLSVFGAAKVSHFEILCRVHGFQPSVNLFRAFYTSSYNKGWMSFIKRSDAAPVCHSKPLDSVKNWNDHFFWVDSKAFPLSVSLKSKILSKDPSPKLSQYDTEACEFLRTHTAPFRKFPEPFLCWVGISRYYTLDENSYPTFWDGDEGGYIFVLRLKFCFVVIISNTFVVTLAEMDLFAFIRHSDPTKVRVGERNLADTKLKLLKMTEGRTVALDPPATAASGGSSDSIDRIFDEGDNAGQEHPAEKDDDVQEEVIAKDASKVLRDDHQSLPPSTGGKSLSTFRGIVPEGAIIPSDAARPLVTAFVTPMPDVKHVDSVSGLNLRTRPPHERYVVSSDSSHHSGSYSEAASLIRYAVDVLVVTVAITTTADANVATGSKAKDAPKEFEHIGHSASAGGVDADATSISKLKNPSISWKLRPMDYDQVYSKFNVGATRQVCLGAGVKMQAEHTLEKKGKLEDKCAEQTALLSERDAEIVHLKSLLYLKEAEAAKAISLHSQLSVVEAVDAANGTELRDLKEKNIALEGEKNVLSERVETLESVIASKDVELASLSSQVANLTADFSGFRLSRDELNSKVASLESEKDCLATQVEKKQDEQMRALSERVAAIDSDLLEMVLHMDAEFYPRYLTTIAGRRWILSRGLKLVLAKCLSSPEYLSAMGEAIGRAIDKGMQDGLVAGIEHGTAGRSITDVAAFNPSAEGDYVVAINALQGVSFPLLAQLEANKDASMADIMDLLRLEGPAAETSEAGQLQPSLDQLMIPIHRLEDQVIIGETSLAFSLEVAHNHLLNLRGDAAAHSLSLTDSMLPLIEPLSARNLTGKASPYADVATAVTTALQPLLAQTYLVSEMLSTLVLPSPKVVFEEEEELDTMPEHAPVL
ncbi:hypothetical protein Tco_1099114 [Tanacetum coccineum]